MKSFTQFYHLYNITEELHQELKNILNEPETDRERNTYSKLHQQKLNKFTKKFRSLVANNEDTGIENDKPKKGSSRAVFFPKEHKAINVDGQDVKQPTAVKVAFAGVLDKHTGDSHLLGEHQNAVESDHYTRQNHSMLHRENDGSYTSNPHGVTAPVLNESDDHNHWLEMAKADKMSASKFSNLTKTESHPKGLKFNHFVDTLQHDHADAHGHQHHGITTEEERDHIRQHPLYDSTEDFMHSTDNHPGDLRLANYGVWKHPVTGKEHPVITDYGFSNHIAKLYAKGRRNQYNR